MKVIQNSFTKITGIQTEVDILISLIYFLKNIFPTTGFKTAFIIPFVLWGLYMIFKDKNKNITVWLPVRLCLYLSAFCFVVTIIWYQVPILFGEDFVFLVGLSAGLLFASGISAVLQALTGYFQRKTGRK